MTFSATVATLIRQGAIEPFVVPDWETRCAIREVYVAKEFWDWIDGDDALHAPLPALGRRSVFEHIEGMLADFRCAERPPGGSELRRMMPHPQGVYRLQPAGARLFGWMPVANCFVAVSGDTEAAFKANYGLTQTHVDGVRAFRRDHGLQDDFLTGDYRALFTR